MAHEGLASSTEGFFRDLVEQAVDMIAVVGPQGSILYSNPRIQSALGYRREELAGKTLFELAHVEDRARLVDLFDRELRVPGARASFGTKLRRKGGSWRAVDALARVLDGDPPAGGILVTLRDAAEGSLMGALVSRRTMDDISGYVRAGSDGRITACNPAFIRTFGFESEDQAKGADLWTLFPQSDLREKLAVMLGELGKVENFEVRGLNDDGTVMYLLMNLAGSIGPNGELESLEAQILDITEKRKLEEQWGRAQRMEAMGRLSCAIAHDFNNLLTAILGYTELLQDSLGTDSPHQRQIEQVHKAGLKAAALTRQLLTFGRGKVVDAEVIRPNEVVEDMRPLVTQLLGSEIELVLELAEDLDPVEMDKSQLEQVVMNLALNARDAMEGDGRLTVRTQNHRVERPFVLHHDSVQPGDYTMLSVRDTGCGIEPAIMEHLFEPFFTTKETGKGTGLGLATVYGIVKQNGGFISVYNEPRGGVTFKVSFPSVKDVEAPAREAEPSAVAPELEAQTILLVDDDDAVLGLMRDTLRARGYNVLAASDGLEALELARSHRGSIELLLTDISMPRLDGLALAQRFSADRPSVPILLVSGTATAESLVVDTDAPVEFLEKPFTPSTLMEWVRALL